MLTPTYEDALQEAITLLLRSGRFSKAYKLEELKSKLEHLESLYE